jgi:hypothetical protein
MTYDEHAKQVAARVTERLGAAAVPRHGERERCLREVHGLLGFLASPERIHLVVPAIHDLWSAHQLSLGFRGGETFQREGLRHDMLKSIAHFSERERRFDEALALGDTAILRDAVAAWYRLDVAPASCAELRFDEERVASGVACLAADGAFVRAVADPIHRHWQATRRQLRLAAAGDPRVALPLERLDSAARALLHANIRVDLHALLLLPSERPMAAAS